MEDKQAATLITTMSLARRTGYLERNVDPRLGQPGWRQADVISMWAMEHILELPDAATYDELRSSGFAENVLTLSPLRQTQARMSHRAGGLGVESARRRSRAAFVGSLVSALPTILANVDGSYATSFRAAVGSTPTVQALLQSIRSMVRDGVQGDDLKRVIPESWINAATVVTPVGTAHIPTFDDLAGHDSPSTSRSQAAIGKLLNDV